MDHSLLKTKSPCPCCGKILDAAMGKGVPKHNDVSVCAYCAAPLRYEKDLSLHALTEAEVAQFDIFLINQILDIQTQILAARRLGQNFLRPR